MESTISYEFKTTCVKPLINESIMDRITRLIYGAGRYVIQRFQPEVVLHPEFFQENDYQFSEEEFLQLKSIANSRVKNCIIR